MSHENDVTSTGLKEQKLTMEVQSNYYIVILLLLIILAEQHGAW